MEDENMEHIGSYGQERQFESIVENIPDPIARFDRGLKLLYANKAFLATSGYKREDIIGKTISELGTPADISAKWTALLTNVFETGEPAEMQTYYPISNKPLITKVLPECNERGEFETLLAIGRDVTGATALKGEAAKQEEDKYSGEEQFRALTQSLPQLIWTAGADGSCNFFNRQWYDYTGSSFEGVKGDGWITYIHPDQRDEVFASWQQRLASGKPVTCEFQLKDRKGRYNWFFVTANPIKDETGIIKKWVGALTNIEEQKETELQLQELVNKRTNELQQSNADLQKFAHVASHDLSEPVRKIHMLADRLKEEDGDKLSENGRFYVERINSAADRMSNMIEGVLEYSVLTNLEQSSEIIDLGDVIKKIEEDLEIVIQQKQVKLEYNELPVLEGVPTLIYQLFYNLIKNSVKFSRTDTTPVITITAETFIKGNNLFHKIVVADNGIGFSNEEAERIFSSFTRLHSKDKYEGTGLGLALCRNITERHGGTITAAGEKGKGAVFTITLPAGSNAAK
jgi:PAS domain S-box-containing protein